MKSKAGVRFLILNLLIACAAIAGPISPPAGPVAPTPGPEPRVAINADNTPGDADSLFRITQPGSYYLTSNITGVANKRGIEIAVGSVTIDLNGFEMQGIASSLEAVATVASRNNITVKNGVVAGWGGTGIDLAVGGTAVGSNCSVADVTAINCGGEGILIGVSGSVKHCHVSGNAKDGIRTNSSCLIESCTAQENVGSGIYAGSGSNILNCTALSNGSGGPTDAGIFHVGIGSIQQCTSVSNNGYGFQIFGTISVSGCSASTNTKIGIIAGNGCVITDCAVNFNGLSGINVPGDCYVFHNTLRNNGQSGSGAAILVDGTKNRIESNNCSNTPRGIEVTGTQNIIHKNTCSSNTTNWIIAVNNSVGPIVLTADNIVPINGNTYPGNLGSTDPNTNYTN